MDKRDLCSLLITFLTLVTSSVNRKLIVNNVGPGDFCTTHFKLCIHCKLELTYILLKRLVTWS